MSLQEISFRNGLITTADYLSMPPGYCMTFNDFLINYNILSPRPGIQKLNTNALSSTSDVIHVRGWIDNTTADITYLYALTADGKIFRSNSNWSDTVLSQVASWTDISAATTWFSSQVTSDSLNGILLLAGLGHAPAKVADNTSNAAALGGSPPTGNVIRVVNNIAFIANISASKNRVYWSNVNDPETWGASNFIDFLKADGDRIQALGSVGTDLLIFKQKGIARLSTSSISIGTTSTLGPFTSINENIGCLGPMAVDSLDDGRCVFWGSDYNVWITDGNVFEQITDQPPPGFSIIAGITSGSPFWTFAVLRYYGTRKEIIISDPNSSLLLAFDIERKYWRVLTGLHGSSVGILYPNRSPAKLQSHVLLIGNDDSNIYIVDSSVIGSASLNNEDGGAITAEISTSVPLPAGLNTYGFSSVLIIGSLSGSSAFSLGYDNSYGTAFTPASGTPIRWPLSLSNFPNSIAQQPSSLQLKITNTNPSTKIYGAWLSSEVLA